MKKAPLLEPLSDDDLDALAKLLVDRSPFDVDALLGLLHAVSIAPGSVPPPTWLQLVLPVGIREENPGEAEELTALILRLHRQVVLTLEGRNTIIPEADDVARCAAFADGFLRGAAADPTWLDDDERWTFASWAAYLAGRRDLIAPALLEDLDDDAGSKAILRKQMGSIIVTTNETFVALRQRTAASTSTTSAQRPGRNDPCPCGSGKKYKRCCAVGNAP